MIVLLQSATLTFWSFCVCFPAGFGLQSASPWHSGSNFKLDNTTSAIPVPAWPRTVHSAVHPSAGPGAQPAGDGHHRCAQPAQQCPVAETPQRGSTDTQQKSRQHSLGIIEIIVKYLRGWNQYEWPISYLQEFKCMNSNEHILELLQYLNNTTLENLNVLFYEVTLVFRVIIMFLR